MERAILMPELIKQILTLSRLWEYYINYHLRKDMTFQQFLLLATLDSFFTSPPNLKEVAEKMLISYQSVKKLALQLQKKGFVRLQPEVSDRRNCRIITNKKHKAYWQKRADKDLLLMAKLFSGVSDAKLNRLSKQLDTLINHAAFIREEIQKR